MEDSSIPYPRGGPGEGRLYPLMMAVARGEKDKAAIAHTFRELAGQ